MEVVTKKNVLSSKERENGTNMSYSINSKVFTYPEKYGCIIKKKRKKKKFRYLSFIHNPEKKRKEEYLTLGEKKTSVTASPYLADYQSVRNKWQQANQHQSTKHSVNIA